jgi:hypothetical protein
LLFKCLTYLQKQELCSIAGIWQPSLDSLFPCCKLIVLFWILLKEERRLNI